MTSVKGIDAIPIIDAKRPITLHITPKDCANANPKEPSTCAAAKCIKRELGAIESRVHLGRVYIRQNKGNWQRYQTPSALRNEIISFDRGGTFEPGEYTLLPIRPSHLMGKRQGSKPKFTHARKNPKRKVRMKHITANVRNGPA